MVRICAGISYALTEAMGQGHCGLPVAELKDLAEKLLEVDRSLITTALELELVGGTVISDTVGGRECIFLGGLYHAEKKIAERLKTLLTGRLPWPAIDPDKALPWIEKRTGLTLAPSQQEAITLALRSKMTVITGGPGVGKTTISGEFRVCSPRRNKRSSPSDNHQERGVCQRPTNCRPLPVLRADSCRDLAMPALPCPRHNRFRW